MKFMGRHRLQFEAFTPISRTHHRLVIDIENKLYSIDNHYLDDIPFIKVDMQSLHLLTLQVKQANYKEI